MIHCSPAHTWIFLTRMKGMFTQNFIMKGLTNTNPSQWQPRLHASVGLFGRPRWPWSCRLYLNFATAKPFTHGTLREFLPVVLSACLSQQMFDVQEKSGLAGRTNVHDHWMASLITSLGAPNPVQILYWISPCSRRASSPLAVAHPSWS
jgi:hypothetical protein